MRTSTSITRSVAAIASTAALSFLAACAARGASPSAPPAVAATAKPGPWHFEVLAVCELTPDRSLPSSDPRRVGGLSGLAYDPASDTFLALSDDQRLPRLYRVRLNLDGRSCRPEVTEAVPLTWSREASASRDARDFEDLSRLPDGSLMLVHEAEDGGVEGLKTAAPGILLASASGVVTRSIPVADRVVPHGATGVRNNAAFESVAVTPDGSRAFLAVEQPLRQDDDVATFARGGASRLFEYRLDGAGYALAREFALPVSAVPHPGDLQPNGADIGVVALTALDASTLLVMERSFVHGTRAGARAARNDILISTLGLEEADEIGRLESLRGVFVRPVAKKRLLSLADLVDQLPPWLATLDNFEGMTFGPALADGSASLVLVSDDNFNSWQHTAFVVLRAHRTGTR